MLSYIQQERISNFVSNIRSISRTKFMLSRAEYETSSITSCHYELDRSQYCLIPFPAAL